MVSEPAWGTFGCTENRDQRQKDSQLLLFSYNCQLEPLEPRVLLSVSPQLLSSPVTSPAGPSIDIWYGDEQSFGQAGFTQRWINVLGNVSDDDGVAWTNYRLNDAAPQMLAMGPAENVRLAGQGDFNIQLNRDSLVVGTNMLVIESQDTLGNLAQVAVTLEYHPDTATIQQYVDWQNMESIQDSAQVVDGLWTITPQGLRTVQTGYDRMVTLGDISWQDYEVTVPITLNSWNMPSDWSDPTQTPSLGIVMRWQGHESWAGETPGLKWWPLGALGWYTVTSPQGNGDLNLLYRKGSLASLNDVNMEPGSTFFWKMQAETQSNGLTVYRLKIWQEGTVEPENWTLDSLKYVTDLTHGSVGLLAHNADVTFGNVVIKPLQDNTAPIAADDAYELESNTTLSLSALEGVLLNDTDPDHDPFTGTLVQGATHGALSFNPDGSFEYTPDEGFIGTDEFTYQLWDGSEYSQVSTVNLTVYPSLGGFEAQDIGQPGVEGLTDYNRRTDIFTVSGSGSDIWGNSDQFHYAYQKLSGDFEVTTKVLDVTHTHDWAKAGLMIRANLNEGSAHASVFITATGRAAFQSRSADYADSLHTSGTTGYPQDRWLKLTRRGSTVTALESYDGTHWQEIASDSISLPDEVYVGMAVTSHDNTQSCTARYSGVIISELAPPANQAPIATDDDYELDQGQEIIVSGWQGLLANDSDSDNDPLTAILQTPTQHGTLTLQYDGSFVYTPDSDFSGDDSFTYVVSDGELLSESATVQLTIHPSGVVVPAWQSIDIGTNLLPGLNSYDPTSQTIQIQGGGADIWGSSDAFHYVYQELSGNGEIVARVTDIEYTHAWAKAGVMIRSDLSAGSPHAMMVLSAARGAAFQYRTRHGGDTYHIGQSYVSESCWVRLSREGTTVTASLSADGQDWSQLGAVSLSLGETAYVGLAVTSHNASTLCTAMFDQITFPGTDIPEPPVNQPPSAKSDTYQLQQDSVLEIGSAGVLANDTDPDGDILLATVAQGPQNGTLELASDGSFRYTPDSGFVGTDRFTYQVTDAENNTDTAEVVLTVLENHLAQGTWEHQIIGESTLAGYLTQQPASDNVLMQAAGSDIWGTADSFAMGYRRLYGDGEISARVVNLSATHPWAKAGVMIRESLSPNSAHAMTVVTSGRGVAFQRRTRSWADSQHTAGTSLSQSSYWVRITREGDTLQSYQSANGTDWQLIDSATISMAEEVYIGLVLTSHDNSILASASFADIKMIGQIE